MAARSLQRDKRGQVTTKAARLERLDPGIPPTAPLAELLEASVESIADRPDQVKASVQELLGLSYEHFTQSVLLPQGGFSDFLRATPANRQRLLVELLAFGVYKEIGQRARDRAARAEDRGKLDQEARAQLADATPEAEQAATGRLDALTELAQTVETSLTALAELDGQAAAARQLAADKGNELRLLSALRMPADVPGLAQQIAAADELSAQAKVRRDDADTAAAKAADARAWLPDKAATQQHLANHALRRELTQDAEREQATLTTCQATEERLAARAPTGGRGRHPGAARARRGAARARGRQPGRARARRRHVPGLPAAGADAPAPAEPGEPDLGQGRRRHRGEGSAADPRRAPGSREGRRRGALAAGQRPGPAGQGGRGHGRRTRPRTSYASSSPPSPKRTTPSPVPARTPPPGRPNSPRAEKARASLGAAEQRARADLSLARDKLIALGAPAITAADLAAAWQALTDWARAEQAAREEQLPELTETAAKLQQQFHRQRGRAGRTARRARHHEHRPDHPHPGRGRGAARAGGVRAQPDPG